MLKALLIVTVPAILLIQCRANHPQSSDRTAENSQRVAQTPKAEEKNCDFSSFKPIKARANYGSPMISMPRPVYPPEARARGIQGRVVVLLLVNVRSGLVEQACVLEGDAALEQAAKSAAFGVKFDAYRSYIQERYSYAEEIVANDFVVQMNGAV